jgi:hypothetical protein
MIAADRSRCEADVVPEFDFSVPGGAPTSPLRSPEHIIDRAQRLVDSPQPYDGYPLEWHYEALNVGDLTAIAMAALRTPDSTEPTGGLEPPTR